MLFMGQDTSFSRVSGAVITKRHKTQRLIAVEIADPVNSAALRENNAATPQYETRVPPIQLPERISSLASGIGELL